MLCVIVQASIELEALAEGHDFYPTITRSKFESLNSEYWKLCIEPVQKVIRSLFSAAFISPFALGFALCSFGAVMCWGFH